MKLGEKNTVEGGKLLTVETFDAEPHMDNVKRARHAQDAGLGFKGYEHVASIPGWLVEMWATEAGVSFRDSEAIEDLCKRKMASGDFSKLLVTKGIH